MNSVKPLPRDRFLALLVVLLAFLAFVVSTKTTATQTSPSSKQSVAVLPFQRQLGIGKPSHLPIKIKEKNINSDDWVHDLEIEVTNTSDKPIYFLSFSLIIQGMKGPNGQEMGFWLRYGRPQLLDFSTPLESTDVPLLPGEKCVLKIPEANAKGWETYRTRENKPQPTKVGLVFQSLNFGDGTGFNDAQGTFIDIHQKVGLDQKCLSPPNQPSKEFRQAFFSTGFHAGKFFSRCNT